MSKGMVGSFLILEEMGKGVLPLYKNLKIKQPTVLFNVWGRGGEGILFLDLGRPVLIGNSRFMFFHFQISNGTKKLEKKNVQKCVPHQGLRQ